MADKKENQKHKARCKHIVKEMDIAVEQSSQTEDQQRNNESCPRFSPGKVWFLCREDLPSQLLYELRVVRREELHHKTKDGVFRP